MNLRSTVLAGTSIFVVLTAPMAAQAQHYGWGSRMGPGFMMGPGMMDRSRYSRMCSPAVAGFAEWRINQIEQLVKPNDAQRSKLDELKAASDKAFTLLRSACPADLPTTMPQRLESMEKRMDGMLQAIKTIRPALDAFYATLTDDQKKMLDSNTTRGPRFWRWRD